MIGTTLRVNVQRLSKTMKLTLCADCYKISFHFFPVVKQITASTNENKDSSRVRIKGVSVCRVCKNNTKILEKEKQRRKTCEIQKHEAGGKIKEIPRESMRQRTWKYSRKKKTGSKERSGKTERKYFPSERRQFD